MERGFILDKDFLKKRLKILVIVLAVLALFFAAALMLFIESRPDLPLERYLIELRNPMLWLSLVLVLICASLATFYFERIYKPWFVLPALGFISFFIFFQYAVVMTWDSSHYLSFLPILNGELPMERWDVVRGPTFPVFLWLIVKLFGASGVVMIIVHYIVYALTLCVYYLIVRNVVPLKTTFHKLTAAIIIYVVIGLNPLVFGYYHVLLTEYLAAFFAAVVICAAVVYYKRLANGPIDWKYRVSQIVLVLATPVLFFLKQNFVMFTICAVLAIILLSIIHRQGIKKIFRASGLLFYIIALLAVSSYVWNGILPEIENDYMRDRTSESMLARIFTPDTNYLLHSNMQDYLVNNPDGVSDLASLTGVDEESILHADNSSNMVITFYDRNSNLIDAYLVNGIVSRYEISVTQAAGLLVKNIFRHPLLLARGITDAYMASTNFFGIYSLDSISYHISSEDISLIRAQENHNIGFLPFYHSETFSYVFTLPEHLLIHAEPFFLIKNPGALVNSVFLLLTAPTNISFTVAFLLLPVCWVGSLVLTWIHKKEMTFIISYICTSVSIGYILLNSLSRLFIDRYNFPVFITTWIAIFALTYGVYKIISEKRSKPRPL